MRGNLIFYVASSDLVTRSVVLCGGEIAAALGDQAQEPHMVTPNDQARAYGLIDHAGLFSPLSPGRKRSR